MIKWVLLLITMEMSEKDAIKDVYLTFEIIMKDIFLAFLSGFD